MTASSRPTTLIARIHLQLRTLLVNPSDEQSDTKRPTHQRLLVMYALAKPQRQITHRLRGALHLDALVVRERVVLRRDARMVDHRPCVRREPGHGAPEMRVYLHYLLDRARFEEGRLDALLDGEDDALFGAHADGRRSELQGAAFSVVCGGGTGGRRGIGRGGGAYFDSFDGVFDCGSFRWLVRTCVRDVAYIPWNNRPSGEKVLTPRSV